MNESYPIDRKEVLNYLHCKTEDETTKILIDGCIEKLSAVKPRFVYGTFKIGCIKENCVELVNTGLKLSGSDIVRHLENCREVILTAATLGEEADRMIRRAQITDMAEAVVLDCCASVFIESVCEVKEAAFRKAAAEKNEYITSRFSPGYGDLPLNLQKDFLEVLFAGKKIGLNATNENLLVPTKSVTAVIGRSNVPVRGTLAGCEHCVLKGKCEFRKSNTFCFEK